MGCIVQALDLLPMLLGLIAMFLHISLTKQDNLVSVKMPYGWEDDCIKWQPTSLLGFISGPTADVEFCMGHSSFR